MNAMLFKLKQKFFNSSKNITSLLLTKSFLFFTALILGQNLVAQCYLPTSCYAGCDSSCAYRSPYSSSFSKYISTLPSYLTAADYPSQACFSVDPQPTDTIQEIPYFRYWAMALFSTIPNYITVSYRAWQVSYNYGPPCPPPPPPPPPPPTPTPTPVPVPSPSAHCGPGEIYIPSVPKCCRDYDTVCLGGAPPPTPPPPTPTPWIPPPTPPPPTPTPWIPPPPPPPPTTCALTPAHLTWGSGGECVDDRGYTSFYNYPEGSVMTMITRYEWPYFGERTIICQSGSWVVTVSECRPR